jgi:heterodisulfide reductase subunit A
METGDDMAEKTKPRIGVIICECGQEIAGVIDTENLSCQVNEIPGVVYSKSEVYPCSKDGSARLCEVIKKQGLERVLIAGCSPRLVKNLFQDITAKVGLHPDFIDVVDIREGCVYVHVNEVEAAFQKALDLIKMGVARLSGISPRKDEAIAPVRSVLVLGSGLSGLTSALTLADSGIPVTLLERKAQLGGDLFPMQTNGSSLVTEKIKAVQKHPDIQLMGKAKVIETRGQPGNFKVIVEQDGRTIDINVGAILIAGGARYMGSNGNHGFADGYVQSMVEFEDELRASENSPIDLRDIVMILPGGEDNGSGCTPLNCYTAIRQALDVKRLKPEVNVTVLFRDLMLGYSGGRGEENFLWAKDEGVTFFRYHNEHPPVIDNHCVRVYNPLLDETLEIPSDRIVLSPPILPRIDADSLSRLFHVHQDGRGFLIERRVPLRPNNYFDDGVYVLGSAHMPVDTAETLFQAYVTSARVSSFLSQKGLLFRSPSAEIDRALCTGCGNCVQVCMAEAIRLEVRDEILSVAEVDSLRCTGCGNCVVTCPVKAITVPGWDDQSILRQINAALESMPGKSEIGENSSKRILAFACEWSAFLAAEVAGARHLPYTAEVRIIPMKCSARFDPNHILWAFLNGADGVFLGACRPHDCHYGHGSLYAQARVEDLKKQLAFYGIDPRRLHLEFVSGDDGEGFNQTITDFTHQIEKCKKWNIDNNLILREDK